MFLLTLLGILLSSTVYLTDTYTCGRNYYPGRTGRDLKEENQAFLNLTSEMIVKGTRTDCRYWPWMAGIFKKGSKESFCGGSVINPYYVLTAKHCLSSNRLLRNLKVKVGCYPESRGREHRAVRRYFNSNGNDISLIKVSPGIVFDAFVQPICLPSTTMCQTGFENQIVYVAGTGTTSSGGLSSGHLLQTSVKVVNLNTCAKNYKRIGSTITACHICAGTGGRDSCQGDSGGPLIFKKGVYSLIGIVSFGFGCGLETYPGVYTSVCCNIQWINATIFRDFRRYRYN